MSYQKQASGTVVVVPPPNAVYDSGTQIWSGADSQPDRQAAFNQACLATANPGAAGVVEEPAGDMMCTSVVNVNIATQESQNTRWTGKGTATRLLIAAGAWIFAAINGLVIEWQLFQCADDTIAVDLNGSLINWNTNVFSAAAIQHCVFNGLGVAGALFSSLDNDALVFDCGFFGCRADGAGLLDFEKWTGLRVLNCDFRPSFPQRGFSINKINGYGVSKAWVRVGTSGNGGPDDAGSVNGNTAEIGFCKFGEGATYAVKCDPLFSRFISRLWVHDCNSDGAGILVRQCQQADIVNFETMHQSVDSYAIEVVNSIRVNIVNPQLRPEGNRGFFEGDAGASYAGLNGTTLKFIISTGKGEIWDGVEQTITFTAGAVDINGVITDIKNQCWPGSCSPSWTEYDSSDPSTWKPRISTPQYSTSAAATVEITTANAAAGFGSLGLGTAGTGSGQGATKIKCDSSTQFLTVSQGFYSALESDAETTQVTDTDGVTSILQRSGEAFEQFTIVKLDSSGKVISTLTTDSVLDVYGIAIDPSSGADAYVRVVRWDGQQAVVLDDTETVPAIGSLIGLSTDINGHAKVVTEGVIGICTKVTKPLSGHVKLLTIVFSREASTTAGDITLSGNILPTANNAFRLGSLGSMMAQIWSYAYFTKQPVVSTLVFTNGTIGFTPQDVGESIVIQLNNTIPLLSVVVGPTSAWTEKITVIVKQSPAGGCPVPGTADFVNCTFAGGAAPVWSLGPNAVDVVRFEWDATGGIPVLKPSAVVPFTIGNLTVIDTLLTLDASDPSSLITLTTVPDAGAAAGSIVVVGNDITVHYKPGASTVADFEALFPVVVTAGTVSVKTPGTGATVLTDPTDTWGPQLFTGSTPWRETSRSLNQT